MQKSITIAVVCVASVMPLAIGLPLITAIQSPGMLKPSGLILFCWTFYVAHLYVLVAHCRAAHRSLRNATAEALEQRGRAEVASQTKSMFLATVSHEIRTPLNAVTSAAHLLGQMRLPDAGRECVSILLNGSEVLLSLINDVLDMSKIEAGKITLDESDIDLAVAVKKLASLWTPKAAERGLTLEVHVDPGLPPMVLLDELRLTQIMFNLVSNAVKFTERGGVRILMRKFEDAGSSKGADGDRLCLEVIDTGPGMTTAVVERLFQSFEQADSSVARRFGGTGLGLAISRRLAELMGGDLTAETVLGRGSTFRLVLPLRPSQQPEQPTMTRDAPSVDQVRPLEILLAEDHPVNRKLVTLFLEPQGWSLTQVENGQEAVELAATRAFDVILMDMQMPVMNGLDATIQIRSRAGPNRDTPVIALTADAFDDQRAAWARAGAAAFLTKPINPTVLIDTIKRSSEMADEDEGALVAQA